MSFLNLCYVFRRFVPNFVRIAATLNGKLEKDQPSHVWKTERELNWSTGKRTASTVITTDTIPTKSEPTLYAWHKRMWQASKIRLVIGAARRTSKALRILVAIAKQGWEGIRHNTFTMSCCHMSRPTAETVSRRVSVYDLSGSRCAFRDIEYDGCTKILARWYLRLSKFDLEVSHQVGIKHQTDSKGTIPPVHDQNGWISAQGWFTFVEGNRIKTRRRKGQKDRKCLA